MTSTNYYIFLMPSVIFMLGGIVACFLKGIVRTFFSLCVPILSFYILNKYFLNEIFITKSFFGYNLNIFVYDKITLLFAYIFYIFSILALIYSSFTKKSIEIGAGLFYVGASLGVIFSGDFFSFYLFWELLTFGATIFIYLGRDKDSKNASFRYVVFHIIGGLILLLGILLMYKETGLLTIKSLKLNSLYSYLIFLGFGVNAGFPFLHTWITDSYPKASISGSVFLSSLTTKVGIYALIRCFVGTQALIYIGAIMVICPVFYAVIENDLRKVLSLSLINQLGFMIIGIGIGTSLAINGAVSHVFVHILYKSLLFMVVGAVIYKYQTAKVTELGGIYKKMPLVSVISVIAMLSISAFPMFSGFVTKSMIISSALNENMIILWSILILGSAAVVKYMKVPLTAFFIKNNNTEISKNLTENKTKIPFCMTLAMSISAILCILIGLFPQISLYKLLPYEITYKPYTYFHVISQLEILFFAGLALYICYKFKFYKKEEDKITVDVDYFYRNAFSSLNKVVGVCSNFLNQKLYNVLIRLGDFIKNSFLQISNKTIEKRFPVGLTLAFIIIVFLIAFFM